MAESKKQKKAERLESSAQPAANAGSSGVMLAVAALLVGAVGGWVGRGVGSPPAASATAKPAVSAGSASACDDWSGEVCKRVGAATEGCAQAKQTAGLLSDAACSAARSEMEATVTKLKSVRSPCETLVTKLCADIGPETETCSMVRDKTTSFPAERCKEMLTHYDEVLGELRSEERDNQPIAADLAQRQAAGDAPGFGPKDAKVTIVEYSDFECPFCGRAAETIGKVKEKYGTKVRFVFRQFPLPMHSHAGLAAEASLAAQAQGKFWPFHDLLFQNQRELDRPALEKYAQKAGLDLAKFKKALDAHTYADAVKADTRLGAEANVSGTPSMFIGTERVENSLDFDVLSRDIDKKLAAN